jgi:hypothetical protein
MIRLKRTQREMDIEWRPGIGDPSAWGWITVVAYAVAAVLALRAANVAQISRRNCKIESAFWLGATLTMIALGINKQLDLQSLLTEVAREWAKESGWYAGRRAAQEIAIGVMILSALAVAIALSFFLRRAAAQVKLGAIALCFVLAYVVIRAASFHHVDALIGSDLLDVSWNAILELPGILVIALSAARYRVMCRR